MSFIDKRKQADLLQQEIIAHGDLSADVKKKINYKFRLDWNYYSNSMEGNTLTMDETRSVMVGNLTVGGKPIKDVLEMKGHDDVVLEILKIGQGEVRLSEHRIKEIHRGIMHEEDESKRPHIGEWKKEPNYIYNYKNERFDFVQPADVAERIHHLLNKTNAAIDAIRANKKDAPHPVSVALEFHLGYVLIHPFYDGNGRTARILTNLLLISFGYPPFWVKTNERSIYNQYIGDIQGYGGNPDLFYDFATGLVIRSQQLVLDAIAGKDISEPEDFEKELQQIEIRLKNQEQKVVKRTPELVNQLFNQSIKPLTDALYEKLTKLNNLFTEFSIEAYGDDGRVGSGNKDMVDKALSEYFKMKNVREIRVDYRWSGFNRAGANTFWLSSSFKINLNDFDYVINEGQRNLYSQQLTAQDIARIVEASGNILLTRMKETYKQITGNDL
jgi:Fic family protein